MSGFPSTRLSKTLLQQSASAAAAAGGAASPGRRSEQTCLALLESSTNSLPKLLQTKAFLLKCGLHNNPLVLTKFTSAASSSGAALSSATSLLFSPLSSPHLYDCFLLNTLIRSHANSSHSQTKRRSLSYYSLMLRLAIPPNKFTFPFLLKACAGLQIPYPAGTQVHASSLKFGFDTNPFVHNTLIHFYSTCSLPDARRVFDLSPKTSAVTWSALIGGHIRSGLSAEAVALFREMQVADVRPDQVTVMTVLSACADLGALDLTRWLGSFVDREKIPRSVPLCNALIDALAKCGDVDGALAVFDRMPERSIVSWTSVIDGLAAHGRGREAVSAFESMKASGIPPDNVAFIGVLTACSHAGLVDEGQRYFDSMRGEFGIVPKVEHYGCIVDLLGRAGLVERAVVFVETMPIEPNPVIWRTLIGACRVHGKLELGERITKSLIDKEPSHSSNYVLLSNVYALSGRWEKKAKIRKAMSKKGIQKVPGCSLLELDGEIYEFVAGDASNVQYEEMYEMVEEMGRELRRAGYVAATSEVLLDLDEEDKEDALHWHSEKLAIAFALLRTRPGTPIRIVKNLRVCADCHSATKFISKVYNREIVVRDRSRFHRFEGGMCSCKDFW